MSEVSDGSQPGGCDGQQEALAEHHVDLDARQLLAVQEREHHQVERVADELHLGPLVALDDVLDDQRVEAQAVRELRQVLRRGVRRVDPDACLRIAERVVGVRHRRDGLRRVPSPTREPRIAPGSLGDGGVAGRGVQVSCRWSPVQKALALRVAASSPCSPFPDPSTALMVARSAARAARVHGQRRDDRGDDHHHGRDQEQAGKDRGRLAGRPTLERIDDQAVLQWPAAELPAAAPRHGPPGRSAPCSAPGSGSSRGRSARPGQRPCRPSAPP